MLQAATLRPGIPADSRAATSFSGIRAKRTARQIKSTLNNPPLLPSIYVCIIQKVNLNTCIKQKKALYTTVAQKSTCPELIDRPIVHFLPAFSGAACSPLEAKFEPLKGNYN